MANNVTREQEARVPIGGMVNENTNNLGKTEAEKIALESELTDGDYIARVRTYAGEYVCVRWYLDGKQFTTYKNKDFTVQKAKDFLQTMIDISEGKPAPESVTVTPATDSITSVETTQLTAVVAPVGSNQAVTWESSDETKATVDEDGLVTGVAAGSATITATSVSDDSLSDTSVITVTAA